MLLNTYQTDPPYDLGPCPKTASTTARFKCHTTSHFHCLLQPITSKQGLSKGKRYASLKTLPFT